MSIVRSSISFSLKLSSLACSSVALSFWAATRMYLTEGDWWIRDNSISREFIHTCPTFEPILHETHYFPHYASNFIYCPAQFVRVRNFQESIELASQSFDALREAFHWSMRVLLGLEMLPISSVMLFESRIKGNPPGMQHQCKKTPFVLWDSAASSQITAMCAFQW